MTICVAVKVNDCLVFAADSATSLVGQRPDGNSEITNVFFNGNKVFNLYRKLPIAAMTSGIGNFGTVSISTIAKDLRSRLMDQSDAIYTDPTNYTMKEVADKTYDYLFNSRFKSLENKPDGVFTFWVGGYSTGSDHSELYKIEIVDGVCPGPELIADADSPIIAWSGQPEAISRLVAGYAPSLEETLESVGVDKADLPALMDRIRSDSACNILQPAMPTKDAIDLADFLVETTKKFVRFLPGANVVGGPTDITAVTKHEGFKWISRKHYYESELNRLETDHVS